MAHVHVCGARPLPDTHYMYSVMYRLGKQHHAIHDTFCRCGLLKGDPWRALCKQCFVNAGQCVHCMNPKEPYSLFCDKCRQCPTCNNRRWGRDTQQDGVRICWECERKNHIIQETIQRHVHDKNPIKQHGQKITSSSKNRAKTKGLEYNLTTQYVIDKLHDIQHCEICNCVLECGFNDKSQWEYVTIGGRQRVIRINAPSIDRIDNTVGYTIHNIGIVCFRCNELKTSKSLSDIRYMAENTKDMATRSLLQCMERYVIYHTTGNKDTKSNSQN